MPLREELRKRIPIYVQHEPYAQALFELISLQKLNTKEELLAYLHQEVKQTEDWIEKNKSAGGTMVKEFRDKTNSLRCLKNCKSICEQYLS